MAEKKRRLAEADGVPYGEKGPRLRRNGLYAGQLSTWRRELAEHGEKGLAARTPGRRPADPRDREIERLKREDATLARRAHVAEQLIELQKKSSTWSTPRATGRTHERSREPAGRDPQEPHLPRTWRAAPLVLSGHASPSPGPDSPPSTAAVE
ncbi:MAG: hypothetical protein M5U09_23695 [Gammaproteobacteria bacterium]|nr:hypothetical protein [Gammaproteobacteria bacterium]